MVGANALTNFTFQSGRPMAGCLICGRVFQSVLDRTADNDLDKQRANQLRQLWRVVHEKSHTQAEHEALAHYKAKGNFCTPEAAQALAPYGVFSVTDLVMSSEHGDALRLAGRAPSNDADDTVRGY